MICRTCGTDIADKAIVCYRCGTATAEPRRRPPVSPPVGRRLTMRLALLAAAAIIVAAAVVVLPRLSEGWPRASAFAVAALVAFVVSCAIRRRVRR